MRGGKFPPLSNPPPITAAESFPPSTTRFETRCTRSGWLVFLPREVRSTSSFVRERVREAKKRGEGRVLTCPTPALSANLPRFQCELTGRSFLLDTGSALCLLPPSAENLRAARATAQTAANADGKDLKIHGSCTLSLGVGGGVLQQEFFIADVSSPIIGSDFLQAHDLAVFQKFPCLRNTSTADYSTCR